MNRQLLEVLVSSSVLILALSAMRLVLRGKISPRLQYGLWLLAAVRLLVPVSIGESRASVMNYVPEQAMVQALEQTHAPVQRTQTPAAEPAAQPAAASAASDETSGLQTDAPDTMQAQQTQQVASQDTPHTQNRLSVLHVCYMLWGAGSALALAFLLAQNLALSARLRKDRVWMFPAARFRFTGPKCCVRRACLGCSARQFICRRRRSGKTVRRTAMCCCTS